MRRRSTQARLFDGNSVTGLEITPKTLNTFFFALFYSSNASTLKLIAHPPGLASNILRHIIDSPNPVLVHISLAGLSTGILWSLTILPVTRKPSDTSLADCDSWHTVRCASTLPQPWIHRYFSDSMSFMTTSLYISDDVYDSFRLTKICDSRSYWIIRNKFRNIVFYHSSHIEKWLRSTPSTMMT